MRYDFNFYSSLLLITFSQGLIYSGLLFKKAIQTETKSNYWLSIFVFLCSMYVAPWMLGFAGWYDNQPYRDFMFYVPFQHLFFIGPIIFFYTQSLLNPSFQLNKKQFSHLIPGILYLIYSLWIFIYDKLILGKYYYYENGMDKDLDAWYQYSGFASMLLYFVLSLKYYSNYQKLVVQITSNADALLFDWIRKYLFAFLGMLLLKLFTEIFFAFYPEYTNYVGGWWFYLLFSLILYYIAITGYANLVETKIGFEMSVFDKKPIFLLDHNQDYSFKEENTIDIEHQEFKTEILPEINAWKEKIETLIKSEKLYQNPELSLTEIAKKLESNSSIISRAINQGFAMNFNDFINNYRIEAVKEMFKKGEHKKSTLIGIAYDCGFNSKATFNRAFKKKTLFSPKDYLAQI
jgi:AraC-like DNA-binding protein